MMRLKINEHIKRKVSKVFLWCNVLICFLLPMNGKLLNLLGVKTSFNLLPVVLVVTFLLSFFTYTFDFQKVTKNKFFKLFLILFVLYCASAFYYIEFALAVEVLSKKISFIAIPIAVFSNAGFYVRKAKKIFYGFFTGVVFSMLVLDVNAIGSYLDTGTFPFYVGYSGVLHPTYIGLNILLLLIMNLHRFNVQRLTVKNYFYHFFVLFFVLLHLFLLLSKGVIIITGIAIVSYVVILLQQNLKKAVVYSSFWMIPLLLVFVSPIGFKDFKQRLVQRFSDFSHYDEMSGSTSFRASILKKAPEILEEDWLFGVGYGMEKEHLDSYYEEIDWQYARINSFNTHNQFLQTWLGIGLGGVFILFVLLFGPFLMPINPVAKLMLFCFAFLFCTEAMLERQAGILLFMLFYSLFIGLTRPKQTRGRERVLTFD